MIKKLWVDDVRPAPDLSWVTATTVNAAIRLIDQFGSEIEECSLDHDISHQVSLGGMSRPYPCDETFEAVARHLALRISFLLASVGVFWRPKVTIHTSNRDGAERMKKILQDAGIEPTVTIMPPANRLETIL